MISLLRRTLRKHYWWIRFQELRREGYRAAWQRRRAERPILDTPPIRTAPSGPVELRVLTWRRDWIGLLWALKSYYHFAEVDYPLYIHDGGLLPRQFDELARHFPNAHFIRAEEADARFPAELQERGLHRSAGYRMLNVSTRKLFDFFLDSQADTIVTIDSDIVFFRRPEALIVPPEGVTRNRYNREECFWYSMTPDELDAAFGVRPLVGLNSGLAVIRRTSINFDEVERYLQHPKMFADRWVTEQTLHALCSTTFGVEFLPDLYRVGGPTGIPPELICKHYPGSFRPLLFSEGMMHLAKCGFLESLRRSSQS